MVQKKTTKVCRNMLLRVYIVSIGVLNALALLVVVRAYYIPF